MQVPLAVANMFDARLNNDRVAGTAPLCSFLTLLTAGYFCTETLIICRNYKEHGIEPLIHATVCIAFFVMVAYKKRMQWFVPRVLFFECSTPLVHMRWLLASMGLADTKLYKVNGIAMMSAFFVCRVVWGTSTPLLLPYRAMHAPLLLSFLFLCPLTTAHRDPFYPCEIDTAHRYFRGCIRRSLSQGYHAST